MANAITSAENARRNNYDYNGRYNIRKTKIYCHNVHGTNWPIVEVNGNKVLDGEKILAEGAPKFCEEYVVLCIAMNLLKCFLDTRKNGELWKSPTVRRLSKEIVKLSKHIRIEDTSGTIGKAHEIVKELREAWQRKQKKIEMAKKEKERAEKSTLQLLDNVGNLLENGASSAKVIPLIENAVRVTNKYNLALMPNIKETVNLAVLRLGAA